MADVCEAVMERNHLTKEDIDWVIPHQANMRIITAVSQRLGVSPEKVMVNIERYGNVVYLIPKEENNFLGFSKQQLKTALCKSAATDKDYYLSQFAILTLLVEFFDGQG